MATKKQNRHQTRRKQAARAARAAELARRERVRRRRLSIGAAVAVIAAVGVLGAFVFAGGGGTTDVSTSPSTTSPSPSNAPASAEGKPCVPVAAAPPPGAPAVPVRVGPPPTELVTEDLKPGTGPVVAAGQTLKVNYIGVACSTGKIFDSSYKTGKPADFPLDNVIPGWQQGIPGMKVGGQRLLGIPAALGYGAKGSGANIAPGEALWFVVEVLDAKPA